MKELMKHFETTFEDKQISTSEKKAIKKLLTEYSPTEHQIDLLRSQIFKLAANNLSGTKNAQVLNWLEDAVKLVQTIEAPAAVRNNVYFSPGTECLDAILAELGSATSTIDVCIFTLSDDRIANRLKYCHQKGIKIRIITDDEKLFDLGSDIETLSKSGISIRIDRTPHHMHHKFAIIDNKLAITGSYNWTRSAEQYNHENILVTSEMRIVEDFRKEFEQLWKDMKPF